MTLVYECFKEVINYRRKMKMKQNLVSIKINVSYKKATEVQNHVVD